MNDIDAEPTAQELDLGTAGLGGRLALLDPRDLNAAERSLYERLLETRVPEAERSGFTARLPDGCFIGPFNVFLHAPEIGHGLLDWADQIAHSGALAPEVRQVVILVVGTEWEAEYELYAHTAAARRAGLPDTAIEAVKQHRLPDNLSGPATVAYRLTDALVSQHQIPDALYAEAIATFDTAGVIAIVNLIGQYVTVAALLNCFRVPVPGRDAQALG